jgi:hypothetical protein
MRKWVLVLVMVLMLLPALACAGWVTETEYGYQVTGTTNTIAVAPDKDELWIRDIFFTPVNASTDTATFTSSATSNNTQKTCLIMNSTIQHVHWENEGRQFRNLEVKLAHATDVVCIYIRK